MAGLTLASPSAERRPAWSPWRETWRRYRRHKLAVVSAVLLLVLIVAVVFGPFVWRVSINDIDFNARLEGPSLAHPFGTDDLGQDILWIDYSAAISLHRVITGNPGDHRRQRLATASPLDKRISYGCINVPVKFYDDVVLKTFTGTSGIVYILPETKPLKAVFVLSEDPNGSGPP